MLVMVLLAITMFARAIPPQSPGTLIIEVRSQAQPIFEAEVRAGDRAVLTDPRGEATLEFPPGEVTLTVRRPGFKVLTLSAVVTGATTTRVTVELEPEVLEEEVTVTVTRTEQRIEDTPIRVEVLQQEEIEEKALMTPGDIAMLLNETSGLRVQVTDPSLGAANVRIQGLRGRYTQLLADGLPLYGGQTGTIGLLQIPPLDLGQVEVIKGVASSLYGASALGGVINLNSRRPEQAEREILFNQTSRGGTDGVLWLADALTHNWRYTLLGGGHYQKQQDLDDDGWADMAGYRRIVVRPRFYRQDESGRSLFVTAGAMAEDRTGGTIGQATVPDGNPFPEELTTQRYDAGVVGRFLAGSNVVSWRGSGMTQHHRHVFGPDIERDRHHTVFGEVALTGSNRGHTWVIGSALQTDLYRSQDVPGFDYSYIVPAIFIQDAYAFGPRFTLSGSGRFDFHSDYGTFFNPHVSGLLRLPKNFTARFSAGTGVFAPTPFTEETEAVGLRNVSPLTGLESEMAWSTSADIGWKGSNIELNGTFFRSDVSDPIGVLLPDIAGQAMTIVNSEGSIRTTGTEVLARFRTGDFGLTFTHTYIHSTELDPNETMRQEVPLTPRHAAGLVGMWEKENRGRLGVEVFYTGRQRLDHNPYRTESEPYWIVGILAERRFGPVRLFINGENLTNRRQTRYDPLVRPQQHVDGRWTVDAWVPLEGRTINGGMRLSF
ncbi:MAG TPA: TonB-dependent receptor [Terriglobia bacterium]|nr:TonB-dependent receptor [Terriglobia bacterium]